jgi:uncharacterized protein
VTHVDVDFPFHVAQGATAATDVADHVRDMVEQVLFTSPGERVNRPDFGCGLLDLVFTPNSPELAAALELTARAALQRWLGDIVAVQSLQAEADDSTLHVSVVYTLLATGQQQAAVIDGSAG